MGKQKRLSHAARALSSAPYAKADCAQQNPEIRFQALQDYLQGQGASPTRVAPAFDVFEECQAQTPDGKVRPRPQNGRGADQDEHAVRLGRDHPASQILIRAFSARVSWGDDFLGRCPRLELRRAVGAEQTRVDCQLRRRLHYPQRLKSLKIPSAEGRGFNCSLGQRPRNGVTQNFGTSAEGAIQRTAICNRVSGLKVPSAEGAASTAAWGSAPGMESRIFWH